MVMSPIQGKPGIAMCYLVWPHSWFRSTCNERGTSWRAAFPRATAPIESPIGQIAPGRVAAQRFVWQGLQGGEPVIEAIVNWFMGPSGFDRPWSFGERGPRYEAEVRGDPSLSAVFTGMHPHSVAAGLKRNEGIVATAMHCVNAIPYLCQADPGIRSYLDLPMICGRADPALLS